MSFYIVGSPGNRRVRAFQATAKAMGFAHPECIHWCALIDDWEAILPKLNSAGLIRLESPGENDELLQRLIRLGGGDGKLAFGEIGFLREQYVGFCKILERLSTVDTAFQNLPVDVKVMFDKWSSHERFAAAGISRPKSALAPDNLAQFRQFRSSFCTQHSGRIFLKPRYASSASGVCAYRWSHEREQLIAPIEIQRVGGTIQLYNTLRVRKYTSHHDVDAILEKLLPQGMICEKWVQKAHLQDGQFDLRILVIGGEARHVVVRQSHSPMTNLHLGNQRGEINEVRELVGERVIDACSRLAENAAACFPNSLYAGVDVLVPIRGEPLICEINAFGDLLPNLRHRGETTYEAILRASHVYSNSV